MKLARETECQHIKTSGERCQAHSITNSNFCFFHDPSKTEERRLSSIAGGSKGKLLTLPPETLDLPLEDSGDVLNLLAQTINQVRQGKLDPKIGNTIGYLSTIFLRTYETYELEFHAKGLLARVEELARRELHSAPQA